MKLKSNDHLTVFLPDTRGVVVSRFGRGNLKIGEEVYTYSRLPGNPSRRTLGLNPYASGVRGTCPGSSEECERICYARRPVVENGVVFDMWRDNTLKDEVPALRDDAVLLRLHVSGDFDTPAYVLNWIERLRERPDVKAWGYTRSWRVPELLPHLEVLRALPNVQLFASMDVSTPELPPPGWRRAWIDGDPRAGTVHSISAHSDLVSTLRDYETQTTGDGVKALICPEETKAAQDCVNCGFCVRGTRNDVVFLVH